MVKAFAQNFQNFLNLRTQNSTMLHLLLSLLQGTTLKQSIR